jgi:hypothetical protein
MTKRLLALHLPSAIFDELQQVIVTEGRIGSIDGHLHAH